MVGRSSNSPVRWCAGLQAGLVLFQGVSGRARPRGSQSIVSARDTSGAPPIRSLRQGAFVVRRVDVADQIRKPQLVCMPVVQVFGRWNDGRGFVVLDRFAPTFGKEERAQAVAEHILPTRTVSVQPDSIHVREWRRL